MSNWSEVRLEFPVTETSTYLNTAAAGPLGQATAKAGAHYYAQMMKEGDVVLKLLDGRIVARQRLPQFQQARQRMMSRRRVLRHFRPGDAPAPLEGAGELAMVLDRLRVFSAKPGQRSNWLPRPERLSEKAVGWLGR